MNAHQMARTAYATPNAAIRTHRGTEYEAFAQITREMNAASAKRAEDFPRFAEALDRNRRLWSLLAADVSDGANTLPGPLRARIFYLYEFTVHHTKRILAGDAAADILVEVNTAVMQGLRGGQQS